MRRVTEERRVPPILPLSSRPHAASLLTLSCMCFSVFPPRSAQALLQHEPPVADDAEQEDESERRRSSVATVKPRRIVVRRHSFAR